MKRERREIVQQEESSTTNKRTKLFNDDTIRKDEGINKSCRLFYIYSDDYAKNGSLLPSNTIHKFDENTSVDIEGNRSLMVHSLIHAYGLHSLENVSVVEPVDATLEELGVFHSKDYLEAMQIIDDNYLKNNNSNGAEEAQEDEETSQIVPNLSTDELTDLKIRYGFVEDAEPFPNMVKYCQSIVGGSLACADIMNQNGRISHVYHTDSDQEESQDKEDNTSITNEPLIAIAWEGGRHHCFRSKASGFCYVNDVVLTVLRLLKNHKRVLCIDTDVHHHDGVQAAFYHSDRVMTLSFHEYGPGIYPGTGAVEDCGMNRSRGLYYNCNVPFSEGIVDSQYFCLFRPIVKKCIDLFEPECIVWVCGADLLSRDKLGHANLSLQLVESLALYLRAFILDDTRYKNLRKLCVLGGGGYDNCKTSICWATITAALAGVKLSREIPEHDFFELYKGTQFERCVESARLIPNYNTPDSVKGTLEQVIHNLERMKPSR